MPIDNRGEKGEQGRQGEQGVTGQNGDTRVILPPRLIWKVVGISMVANAILVLAMAGLTQQASVNDAVDKAVPEALTANTVKQRQDCNERLVNLIAIRDLALAASKSRDKLVSEKAQTVVDTYEQFLPRKDRVTSEGKALPEFTCETRFQ